MKKVENAIVLNEDEYEKLKKAADASEQKKPRAPLCTSKTLLYTILATTIILTAMTALGAFFSDRDMTVMGILAGLSWGVTAADAAVYSSKAKAENKIKLTEAMINKLAEKWGIANVIEIARIVLPD